MGTAGNLKGDGYHLGGVFVLGPGEEVRGEIGNKGVDTMQYRKRMMVSKEKKNNFGLGSSVKFVSPNSSLIFERKNGGNFFSRKKDQT